MSASTPKDQKSSHSHSPYICMHTGTPRPLLTDPLQAPLHSTSSIAPSLHELTPTHPIPALRHQAFIRQRLLRPLCINYVPLLAPAEFDAPLLLQVEVVEARLERVGEVVDIAIGVQDRPGARARVGLAGFEDEEERIEAGEDAGKRVGVSAEAEVGWCGRRGFRGVGVDVVDLVGVGLCVVIR
jgi:hypothetical protein